MDEVRWVAPHALWLLGAALLLATWSYRSWRASVGGSGGAAGVGEATSFGVGALLVALGMMALSGAWWERAGWALVIVLVGVEGLRWWRVRRGPSRP